MTLEDLTFRLSKASLSTLLQVEHLLDLEANRIGMGDPRMMRISETALRLARGSGIDISLRAIKNTLAAVLESPGGITVSRQDIASRCSLSRTCLDKSIRALKLAGVLTDVSHGIYRIAVDGRKGE